MPVKFTRVSGSEPKLSKCRKYNGQFMTVDEYAAFLADMEKLANSPLGKQVVSHPLPLGGYYQEILNPGSYKTQFAQNLTFFQAGTPYVAEIGKIDGWTCTVYEFFDGKVYTKIDHD